MYSVHIQLAHCGSWTFFNPNSTKHLSGFKCHTPYISNRCVYIVSILYSGLKKKWPIHITNQCSHFWFQITGLNYKTQHISSTCFSHKKGFHIQQLNQKSFFLLFGVLCRKVGNLFSLFLFSLNGWHLCFCKFYFFLVFSENKFLKTIRFQLHVQYKYMYIYNTCVHMYMKTKMRPINKSGF